VLLCNVPRVVGGFLLRNVRVGYSADGDLCIIKQRDDGWVS